MGRALGLDVLDFAALPLTACARMVGNGMALPCVAAVLAWARTWTSFDGGPVPPTVSTNVYDEFELEGAEVDSPDEFVLEDAS